MDKELLIEGLQAILYVVITIILPIVTTYGIKILKLKIEENTDDKNEALIMTAVDIVAKIVLSIQQTYVDSLKARGEFTPAAAQEAKEKAVKLANEMIAQEIKDLITSVYSSFDEWLDVQIERNVYINKE